MILPPVDTADTRNIFLSIWTRNVMESIILVQVSKKES